MTARSPRLGGMTPLLLGAAAMLATMYSAQAILPELGRAFAVTPAESGLTMTALIVALAGGVWLWAPLSRRLGLRRSLLLACAALVVPTLGVALAPTFPALVAARALQGLCMPGLLTVGVAYIARVFGPRIGARAMGYYVGAMVLGGLVGRVGVGALTALAGWRVALALLALLPFAAAVVMARSLPEAPDEGTDARDGSASSLRGLVRNRSLTAAVIGGSCLAFGFNGAFSFVGFRLEAAPFSLPPATVSLVFTLWIFGLVGPTAGRLAGRIGWSRLALGAMALAAVGLVLSVSESLPLLCVGLLFLAVGQFCGITATQLGVALATDSYGARAAALYYSVYYVASALAGYVPGLAWQAWRWDGVALLSLAVIAIGSALLTLVAAGPRIGGWLPDRLQPARA